MSSRTELQTVQNYVLINERKFETDISPHPNVTADSLSEDVTTVTTARGDGDVHGVLAQDPTCPFIQVKVKNVVSVDAATEHLQPASHAVAGQSLSVQSRLVKELFASQDVALRGNKKVPTVDELKKRAWGAAFARGLVSHAAPPSLPGGDLPAFRRSNQSSSIADAPPRSDLLALTAEPANVSASDVLGGVLAVHTGGTDQTPSRSVGSVDGLAFDPDASTVASLDSTPVRLSEGGAQPLSSNDVSDRARFKEITALISVRAVLEKQKHKQGDAMYSLRRWMPDTESYRTKKDIWVKMLDAAKEMSGPMVLAIVKKHRVVLLKAIQQ